MSLIIAMLMLGIIIMIHEFGHFLFAKLNGIGVIEFSLGMGPRLFSFEKGGTRYSFKILPFGGSCMMLGEDEGITDESAFNNKSVWARISVVAAGPVFNFILAFGLSMVLIGITGYDTTRLAGVVDGYPAQAAGMEAGDVIKSINGKRSILTGILTGTCSPTRRNLLRSPGRGRRKGEGPGTSARSWSLSFPRRTTSI